MKQEEGDVRTCAGAGQEHGRSPERQEVIIECAVGGRGRQFLVRQDMRIEFLRCKRDTSENGVQRCEHRPTEASDSGRTKSKTEKRKAADL